MKNISIKVLVAALLTAVAVSANAGEEHKATKNTKWEACAEANRLAEKAASSKGTCVTTKCDTTPKTGTCTQDPEDKSFTCKAVSANQSGSC